MAGSHNTKKQRKMSHQSSSSPVDRFKQGHNGQNSHNHKHFNQNQHSPKSPVSPHQKPQLHQQQKQQYQQQHNQQKQQQQQRLTQQQPQQAQPKARISNVVKPTTEMFDPMVVAQYMQWKTASRAGPGLFNHGNTCFLNSTIQCLLHTPALAQVLVKESKMALRGLDSNSMMQMYQSLVADVWAPATPKRSMSPRSMVQNIRRVGKQFRPNRQEDAHEYLRQLLDCMHEEIMKAHHVKTSDGRLAETSLISRVFGGYLRNELKCSKCPFSSKTYNHFQDLSLEIAGGISSVPGALKAFVKIEKLSSGNEWKCDGCKNKVQASKQMTINSTPNVLVIHLKRFSFGGQSGKVNKKIEFDILLDVPCSGENERTAFSLLGIVVHHGQSIHSGHYVAYVKAPNGQWYEMNDEDVTAVSAAHVLQQQAYILFYSKNHPVKSTESVANKAVQRVMKEASVTMFKVAAVPNGKEHSNKEHLNGKEHFNGKEHSLNSAVKGSSIARQPTAGEASFTIPVPIESFLSKLASKETSLNKPSAKEHSLSKLKFIVPNNVISNIINRNDYVINKNGSAEGKKIAEVKKIQEVRKIEGIAHVAKSNSFNDIITNHKNGNIEKKSHNSNSSHSNEVKENHKNNDNRNKVNNSKDNEEIKKIETTREPTSDAHREITRLKKTERDDNQENEGTETDTFRNKKMRINEIKEKGSSRESESSTKNTENTAKNADAHTARNTDKYADRNAVYSANGTGNRLKVRGRKRSSGILKPFRFVGGGQRLVMCGGREKLRNMGAPRPVALTGSSSVKADSLI